MAELLPFSFLLDWFILRYILKNENKAVSDELLPILSLVGLVYTKRYCKIIQILRGEAPGLLNLNSLGYIKRFYRIIKVVRGSSCHSHSL